MNKSELRNWIKCQVILRSFQLRKIPQKERARLYRFEWIVNCRLSWFFIGRWIPVQDLASLLASSFFFLERLSWILQMRSKMEFDLNGTFRTQTNDRMVRFLCKEWDQCPVGIQGNAGWTWSVRLLILFRMNRNPIAVVLWNGVFCCG